MQVKTLQASLLLACTSFLGSVFSQQVPPLVVQTVCNIGLGVWIENIAVQAGGEILAVGLTPNLFQVNPLINNPTPTIVHTFSPPITALAGITETYPNLFYVAAGNVSNSTVQPTPGTMSVWEVNMTGFTPKHGLLTPVRKVADFPTASLLDGMTTVNAVTGLILISDPILGVVWSLNVNTGATAQVINLPILKSTPGSIPNIGVNGIHFCQTSNVLYFTSTDQKIFAKLPLNPQTGAAAGPLEIVASAFGMPDDFALDTLGNAYVAVNSSSLVLLQPNGNATVLAGGINNLTALPGITGAKFGRTVLDKGTLYMGTTGGSRNYITRQFTIPGGISKVQIYD